MTRVLITGGAGFIGSHIVDRLLAQGAAVLVVDDLSTGRAANLAAAAELVQISIVDPAVADTAQRFGAEAIVHCAAQSSVAVSMEQPERDATTNIIGGIRMRDAAVAAGCAQFVYINTGGALYGEPEYLPMDEEHPIRPTSGYGLSKWTCEAYLRMLLPESVALKVLRLANVYGPRQDPYGEAGVIGIFGARMARDQPVMIHGDGEQTRDFVYVADVARAVELALVAPDRLTANISAAEGTSVNEIFRLLADASGYTRDAIYGSPRPGDVRHSVLANARAGQILGWTPQTPLAEGLRTTLEWTRTDEALAGAAARGGKA